MGGIVENGCCFSVTSFFVYTALIPLLLLFVIFISWRVYLYYLMIIMMEIRLLERKVKKIASKIGKSSNSDPDKGFVPVSALSQMDPLLNTDSTNKNHMGDRIPIHLVHSGRVQPSSGTAPVSGPAAAAAVASGPASEEPLSPRTPAKDPATNEEVTEISGYNTQTGSDYVNVSPQDTRKLPDMSDLPSVSTMDQTTDADTLTGTSTVSQMTTTTTSTGTANTTGKKDETDTMKMLDDPIYGLKTEILSPDATTRSELTNDPFQTYAVPKHMLRDSQPQGKSNLKPAASDTSTNPVTNPHLNKSKDGSPKVPSSGRIEDVVVYTPPDHSPVASRTDPAPASVKPAPTPEPVAAPSQRSRPSYQRFPDPAPTTDPIFTPPRGATTPERRERPQGLFDMPARPAHYSPGMGSRDEDRTDRQYAKPSGYFAQRAKAWLADNRDSDSVEEK